jgi:Putative beta barrel porin-7 (BBP7)
MKRILLGLGCTLAVGSGALFAQDAAPAARLGRPAATLGRPVADTVRAQAPDVTTAAVQETPKVMPKGAVTESPGPSVPGTLPVPSAAPKPTGPVMTVPAAPGMITGPVIVDPPGPVTGPVVGPPIPTGPVISDPIVGGCPVGGCPVPGVHSSNDGWYTSVEALLWYVKSYSIPALATTGPAFSGATLSTPGVHVLNPPTVDTNPRYGGRVTLGYWFSPQWAIEASGFYIRPDTDRFAVASAQFPALDLARPFLSANTGLESSEIIGRPGVAAGMFRYDAESHFYGAEVNLRNRIWDDCANRLDLLFGYRYLLLEERLTIQERTLGLAGAGAFAGVERVVADEFVTRNQFNGVQVGAIFEHVEGPWTFGLTAKVAGGITHQTGHTQGYSVPITGGTAGPASPGGLLALNSNIGVHSKSRYSVVPEVGLNVGYDVTDRLRVFAGYSLMYWTNVHRPSGQIDRTLDENRIPGFPAAPAAPGIHPAPLTKAENLWAQGVNVGILWKW